MQESDIQCQAAGQIRKRPAHPGLAIAFVDIGATAAADCQAGLGPAAGEKQRTFEGPRRPQMAQLSASVPRRSRSPRARPGQERGDLRRRDLKNDPDACERARIEAGDTNGWTFGSSATRRPAS
jgi:hypothetical protein